MKIKFLIAVSVFAFSTIVQAMPTKPEKCPGINEIASVGLSKDFIGKNKDNDTWTVGMPHNMYKTNVSWTFLIGNINAKNQDEAYQKANDSLPTLIRNSELTYMQDLNVWMCFYKTKTRYNAVSISPAMPMVDHNIAHFIN